MAKPHKVFGIGLNKTGTTTLKLALRKLGFDHSRRQTTLARAWMKREFAPIFAEADKHDSFEDWPWPLMYRELWQHYGPSARYILTRRQSPEVWVESLKKHAERTSGVMLRQGIFGYPFPHGVETEHMAFYQQHLDEVRAFFADKPNCFLELCWEEGDGWAELCAFLNEPVPNTKLPHGNSGKTAVPDPKILEKNRPQIRKQIRSLRRARRDLA